MIGLRKRPFAYTDPLVRGFISLGEKEAQQEQKYSTIDQTLAIYSNDNV